VLAAEQDEAHNREWAEYLALGIRDALHAGDQGAFDDDGSWEDHSAFYYPWQFDLADIQAPVSLWHGLEDWLRDGPGPRYLSGHRSLGPDDLPLAVPQLVAVRVPACEARSVIEADAGPVAQNRDGAITQYRHVGNWLEHPGISALPLR
jgi:hypothetical protein